MGVTRLSCCCFAPFTPESGKRLQSGVKTAAPLAENSSHGLGGCTQGNPALTTVGVGTSSNLALRCPFPVLQQRLNGPGTLKDLFPAVHHIPLPTGSSVVNGTWQKPGSSTGLSEGAWAGTGLRDVRSLLGTSVPGPVPESCPCCWQKSLLGATQRAGEGAGVRLALEEPVNSPGSGFINASLSADQEQKH